MSLSLSNSLSFALILLVKIEEEEIQKMITIMIEVSVAMMMRTTEMMIMAHRGEEGGREGWQREWSSVTLHHPNYSASECLLSKR